mgnify:CR=1 FL=1
MSWFIDPIKNHYADFSGRVSRKTYWMFFLTYVILAVVIAVTEALIGTNFIGLIFALALLIPAIAIASRRLHDTGLSGWVQLITFIPFLGAVILIVLLVRKSKPGDNKYGPNPNGEMVSADV